MFPDRPNGYVAARENIAHYAANKATAMRCRARGEITTAMIYERICQHIYDKLPDYARW